LGPILNSLGTSIGWSYLFGILLFLGALVVVVFLVFLLGGLFGFSRIKNGDGKWLKIVPAMGVVEGGGWLIVAFFIAFVTVNYWFLSLLLIGVGEIAVAAMSLVALRKNR